MRWLPVIPNTSESPAATLPLEPGATPQADVGAEPTAVPRARRVYVEVFGCQMNKLDAELLFAVLTDEGYRLTDRIEDAGVVLFNTCAVREQAENKAFSKVGALARQKKRDPDLVVGVLGCGAQNHREAIFRRYPHVGIVCGPGEFLRLPEFIDAAREGEQVAALRLDTPVRFERRTNLGPNPHHAYVSVMRGCDMVCTYCIVPKTRGPEVSRPIRDIVDEARALADSGVREITLLGQTVNSYGKRLGRGREIGLQHVLRELDRIPGLVRIRFITSHPRFMNPDLIAAMGDLEKVCEYLHLPVQSGSDAVLRRMQRSYSMKHYLHAIDACRERIPDLGLATDFIVGFCGETDEEFDASVRLMEDLRFQGSFVFRYSERSGTVAADLPDDVPDAVKRERNQVLLELQKRISLEENRKAIGSTVEVLVDSVSKQDKGRWSGRNRRHQIVVFPRRGDEDLVGRVVEVRVDDVTPLVLVGERCDTGEPR